MDGENADGDALSQLRALTAFSRTPPGDGVGGAVLLKATSRRRPSATALATEAREEAAALRARLTAEEDTVRRLQARTAPAAPTLAQTYVLQPGGGLTARPTPGRTSAGEARPEGTSLGALPATHHAVSLGLL